MNIGAVNVYVILLLLSELEPELVKTFRTREIPVFYYLDTNNLMYKFHKENVAVENIKAFILNEKVNPIDIPKSIVER